MNLSKYLLLILLGATKFAISPIAAANWGLNQRDAFIIITLSGLAGFFIFYYFSSYILKLIGIFFQGRQRKRKIFTRKNKLVVRIIRNYGLWLLALLTPILISIPFGAFLCVRYFPRKASIIVTMCASIILWGFILTFFGDLIFN